MDFTFNYQGMNPMSRRGPSNFDCYFLCYSSAMAGRTGLDEGDKILLPPSALDTLARMNVEYPMLFEITNEVIGKKSHCGVLEFSAEEGRCYMPHWMLQNLLVEEGSLLRVKNISLSKCTFVKFRAQSVDFLEISNHRAVLEVTLRKFTCLTVGDTIAIPYADKTYFLDVREVKPNNAASIIETDCNVDFEEPLGYKESEYGTRERAWSELSNKSADGINGGVIGAGAAARALQKARAESDIKDDEKKAFQPFAGSGYRIDGRPIPAQKSGDAASNGSAKDAAKAAALARFGGSATAPAVMEEKAVVETVQYQSRIGDKYSKKKSSVIAFAGAAHKLSK